jgi:hypothetical protein
MSHFLASVSDLIEHALQNCDDSDMVGIAISNEENVQEKLYESVLEGEIS